MTVVFELAAKIQSSGAAEELLLLIAKATLILLIGRVLLAAMPRASAATRHLIATAALLAALLLPVISLLSPSWRVAVRSSTESAARGPIGVTDDEESPLATAISLARVSGVVPERPLGAVDRATRLVALTWKGWLVLWTIVPGLLMIIHMLAGIAGVWHVTRHAKPFESEEARRELDAARAQLGLSTNVGLLVSERISVPVLWGVAQPVLLLPPDAASWTAERLRVVLLHELAHLRRYDGVSLIASRAAVALFWFHPLAWSLQRAARSECERACDDLVLAGGTKPSEYADHLLAIAKSIPTFDPFRTVTLAISRKSQLEGRLLSILQPHVVRRVLGRQGVIVTAVVAVAIVAPLAALRIGAAPAEPKRLSVPVAQASNSSIDVTPESDTLSEFVLAGLEKASGGDGLSFVPKTGEDWHDRGFRFYHDDRYAEAGAAFEKAASLGFDRKRALYNAACSYALMDDAPRAISALERSFAAGWDDMEHVADDSDFDPIRNDPRFARLLRDEGIATNRLTKTVKRYEELRKDSTGGPVRKSSNDWMSVGLDLLRLRRTDEAIHAFKQVLATGQKTSTASYNIACAYALDGNAAEGMAWLDRAIETGFSDLSKLKSDPDITLLRKQPSFAAVAAKAKDLQLRGEVPGIWQIFDVEPDWKSVAAHHRRIADRYPQSGRAWFNLGYTALQARDYPAAIAAYQRTVALKYRLGTSAYNMACAHALAGNRNEAFQWLDRASAEGFDLAHYLDSDEDLESLHDDARWDRLIADANQQRRTQMKSHAKKAIEHVKEIVK
jgi:beta-lactamase regulating signal transducer with metallopeptidase domain/Flp pilus assembly protein TadD